MNNNTIFASSSEVNFEPKDLEIERAVLWQSDVFRFRRSSVSCIAALLGKLHPMVGIEDGAAMLTILLTMRRGFFALQFLSSAMRTWR
eukprot:4525179-Amphidinium_carterae.1